MSKNQEDNEIKIEELIKIKDQLIKKIEDKDSIIIELQLQLEKSRNNSGRKSQVLDLLRNNKSISILDISNELSISTKNVSSQLTYLRSDGYQIYTDPNGRKLLQE
jgi:biotin operon repressor